MLLLHILDGRMLLERGMARAYAQRGIHTFIMHAPSFGARGFDKSRLDGKLFFELAGQAVSDARRARDAIAALPGIDSQRINLQGTSLGGFFAASAGAIDDAFDQTFICLAGGKLYDMFMNGDRESRWIRERMQANGVTNEQLKAYCDMMEPIYLAHRLPAGRTWMFSALSDQVVPAANAKALAAAAKLGEGHHAWLSGDHYTVILHLPWIVETVAGRVAAGRNAELGARN
jgi:dienelactone hydrolase